jgi:hypothetical protein
MWVIYFFVSYLVLALLVPTACALWPAWRRARSPRHVTCPAVASPAFITLDACYAVRMHALGNSEFRVKGCDRWPAQSHCGRQCLGQIQAVA